MAASASAPRWIVWGALLALAAMGTMAVWTATKWHRVPVPGAPAIEVEIPRGASLRTVARELEAAGIVEDATSFELAVRLFGGSPVVKAGTIMVQERLMAAGRLTGEAAVPAEGSVLPATWAVRPGENRAEVLARMQKGMEETLAELWPRRTPAAAVKTPEEAIILASIVEKETGVPEERRRVAGLYTNRLKAGMKLEADPTVIYSITKGKPLGRRIRQSELDADTGWNTYARPGLPKGPITNPGRESIAAVLDPEVHDYLFMVADGTGGHAFAATYAEHRQNVARWYALRRDKGEM